MPVCTVFNGMYGESPKCIVRDGVLYIHDVKKAVFKRDSVEYGGDMYPVILMTVPGFGKEVLIATEGLKRRVDEDFDSNDRLKSVAASEMDCRVFFYVPDDVLCGSHMEVSRYVIEHLG